MADMDTLYRALRNADAAGDVESARKISNYIKGLQPAAPPPRPPSKERTMGEAVSDIGAGLTSGFGSLVQLPGQLYGLATGDFSKTGFLGAGQEISELGQEMKSAGLKAREQARAQKVKEAEEKGQVEAFGAALGETVKDPGLLLNFLTEQAPQLIVPFGGAKIAKGLTMARAGAAGVPLAEAAQAAGTAGTRAAIGTGAVQQGADIGAQAYEDIYNKLKSDGLSDEDAAAGAINLARATGASGAVISLLAQRLPGARTLEEALAGVPGKAGRVVGAGKGALGESASEMAEEVGGKLAQNIAMRQVDPTASLTAGLGETAAMAAIGGAGLGGISGALRRPGMPEQPPAPPPAAPVPPDIFMPPEPPVDMAPPPAPVPPSATPVAPTAAPAAPPAAPAAPPVDWDANYFQGLPEGSSTVFQNRDRSSPASITQMQKIAAQPDYSRVSVSREFSYGAPVVISDVALPEEKFGSVATATASDGTKIPVRYAVVDARDLLASNLADGTKNPVYENFDVNAIRAIAGNGRIAGIQAAYDRGTADNYKNELLADTSHGVNPDEIAKYERPVLIRVMPKSYVTPNIADISNISGTLGMSAIEQAKNDVSRVNIGGFDFTEDGNIRPESLNQFISAMPKEEQAALIGPDKKPTRQAVDRAHNALFYKAYGSDTLINLYAQATDVEARNVLNALARVAPKMAQLEGAGEYDIRNTIVQAAEGAINAKRRGLKISDYAQNADMGMDENTLRVLDMFGENSRSGSKMAEELNRLADLALQQSQAGVDMFGEQPKLPIGEVFNQFRPAVTRAPTPPKTEPKEFQIDKSNADIAKEIKGITTVELAKWTVDNAPNSVAKYIAEKVYARVQELDAAGALGDKVKVLSGNRSYTFRGRATYNLARDIADLQQKITIVGPATGVANDPNSGARYSTILHELIHVATIGQLRIQGPSKIQNDLKVVLQAVRKKIKEDNKNRVQHPFLDRLKRGINAVQNEAELVTWACVDNDAQNYFATVKMGNTNAFSRLADIMRRLLGIDKQYQTALDTILTSTDELLAQPIEDIKREIKQFGVGVKTLGIKPSTAPAPPPPVAAPAVQKPTPPAGEKPPLLDISQIRRSKKPPEEGGRHPQVQAAAKLLQEGKMSREEYEKYVDAYKPIYPVNIDTLFQPSSNERMLDALRGDIAKSKLNTPIKDGTRVGLRMDLPALNKGVPVVSIHQGKGNADPKTGKPYTSAGATIGYASTGYIKNVFFAPRSQDKSLQMGIEPDAKEPLQTAEGEWVNMAPDEVFRRVKELSKDPAWSQVNFDPHRHGYFYDRSTREPVVKADELFQVGNFLLAKNVKYAPKEQFLYESVEEQVEEGQPPVLDTSDIKPMKGRHPQVMAAAQMLRDGAISREDFEKYVNFYKPIVTIEEGELQPPASIESIKSKIDSNLQKFVGAQVPDGTKVGLRLDIKARDRGASVVTVHGGMAGKSNRGPLLSYLGTGYIKDVTFEPRSQTRGLAVAAGGEKFPLQTSEGTWINVPPDQVYARVKQLMSDPNWTQIGFDPTRHGYFYDRETKEPVVAASEMYQVGNFLLAKNVKYAPKEQFLYEGVEEGLGQGVRSKAKDILQKRPPLGEQSMAGLPQDFVDSLNKVFAPRNETVIDRIEGMKDRFWQRLAQGVADKYRTIKDYSEDAYMKARMSTTVDGALEGLLFHGHVVDDGGALNIRPRTKGLIKILEPVGKEVDRYHIWVALNRDARMPADKKSIDPELVARRGELIEGTINGKPRKEVYEGVLREMNAINKSVLDIALAKGLIDQKGYDRFSSDIFYIPFYKVMEDGDLERPSTASALGGQYFSKELKGGEKPFADLMENTLRNWNHILSASMKNAAGKATVDAAMEHRAAIPNLKPAFEMGDDGMIYSRSSGEIVGDGSVQPYMTESGRGTVKIMQDGRPTYYEIRDPLLFESIAAISYMGPKSKFLSVAQDFKNILQFGVTASPIFKTNNLIRDSVSAMGVSDLKKNPIANVLQGMSLYDKDSPNYIAALSGGAIFNFGTAYEGNQSKLIRRLIDQGTKEETILDTTDKIKKALKVTWDKYQDLGNKSEAANRLALYQQLRDKGMSHLQASFMARDLLDFSMQGSWPAFRMLTQTVPFLNARVQGLYKLGRDGIIPTARVLYNTATGKEITESDRRKAQNFGVVTMGVMLASAMLYLAFKDDEDYQNRDEWDRDNFWWFKLPGMDVAFRIPKPFEIGAFGTLVERILEQTLDSGAEGKQFTDSLSRTLWDTFSMNPTPQFLKPLIDIYANKDSFTGSPIETAGLERLSKQERIVDTTSPLAIALGGLTSILPEKAQLSPVQVDYMIKGYFGWLGGMASTASMYAVMPFREGEYPDARWLDRASLGLAKELPSNQSRYITAFYDNDRAISQAYADMRHYAEIGDAAKVMEILEEKGDKIELATFYDKTAKNMANMRKQIRVIMADESMTGAEKKEEIDRIKQMIGVLAQQAEEVRKSLKD